VNVSIFVARAEENARLTALVAEIALETGHDVNDRPHHVRVADAQALRGLPAVGPRSAASAIKGSQPGRGRLFDE